MTDTSNLEQRSMGWRRARLGKLTSSEISVLMKEHKEAMTEEELAEFKAAYQHMLEAEKKFREILNLNL